MRTAARLSAMLVGWLTPLFAGASEAAREPLYFDEVRASVESHDPRIRQAVQELRQAESRTLASRGAFDPRIEGDAKLNTGGYYDTRSADVELRQDTSLWGAEIFAGYRVGLGVNERWPTYRPDQTLSQGEVRAGIEVPVWRGGLIDEQRAERSKAIQRQEGAEKDVAATRLDLEVLAARAYWGWVSAGQSLDVARELLRLAEQRDSQLRRRFEAGSIPEFDVLDNERILLERQAVFVQAERALERATFELSLFFRDANGAPINVDKYRVPETLESEPLRELGVEQAVQEVLSCHPELEAARAEVRVSQVDVKLTRNQLAPEIDLVFQYSRDLGALTDTDLDFTLPGNVFEAGVQLSMPLPFRSERGRAGAARAEVAAQQESVRLLSDQLQARTRDAASAVVAAQARVELTDAVVDTAAALASGERRRFEVGASNLIFVNLREQQAALARVRYIDALALAEIERTRWETVTRVPCRAR